MTTLGDYERDQRSNAVMIDLSALPEYKETTISNTQTNQKQAELIDAFLLNKSRQSSKQIDDIEDVMWVGSSAYEKGYDLSDKHKLTRQRSPADRRFEDTSLGGSYVCNARPGFTPYADVPRRGLLNDRSPFTVTAPANNLGMGDVYARMIDDNYQIIDMRFGKPEYNSLFGFMTTSYSAKDALIANTGSYSGFAYTLGQGAGLVAGYTLLGPVLLTGVLVTSYAARAIQGILLNNPHKFWYVRPQMTMYWRAVHNMVNQIVSFRSMVTSDAQLDGVTGQPVDGNRGDFSMAQELNRLAPDIFSPTGVINVRHIVNRAERLNQHLRAQYKDKMETANDFNDLQRGINEILSGFDSGHGRKDIGNELTEKHMTLHGLGTNPALGGQGEKFDYSINQLVMGSMEQRFGNASVEGVDGNVANLEEAIKNANNEYTSSDKPFVEKLKKFMDYFQMELMDGSGFASFRVDHTGPVSESFSNSTMKNDLAAKFNEISATGRAAHFSFAGGNVIPGMDAAMTGLKSFAGGALNALKLDGLLAMAGASYTDIPEMWENGSFDAPSMNYQFRLVSPSAHILEQIQFIYIPLSMIICAAIPHAAGKASYTQPFFCELYDRGRGIVRNGLITQLLITRGVSNTGFTQSKDALAVDVQFTVKNLSSVNYMPIEAGVSLDPLNTIHTYDSTYSDYIACLGAATLGQNVYKGQKLKIRINNYKAQVSQYTAMDHWAGFVRELPVINNLDIFFPDSGRGG